MNKKTSLISTNLFFALILLFSSSCSSSSNIDSLPTDKVVSHIEIKTLPNQLSYCLKDAINLDGLQVIAVYEDATQSPVQITNKNISGFNSSKPATQQEVVIEYGKQTTSFHIDVLDAEVKNGVLVRYKVEGPLVVIPKSVKVINEELFAENSVIRKVVLPDGLEHIGASAFFATKLEEINFPATLQTIEQDAFNQCRRLKSIDLSKTKLETISASAFFSPEDATEILLPSSLKSIGSQAFINSKSVTEIVIPEGVISIEIEAFRNSGMTNLLLPNGLSFISERAFYYCDNLSHVKTYGDNPKQLLEGSKLGHYAFEGALKLVEFTLPTGISYIGQRVIGGNELLKEFTVHQGVKFIHFSAFGYRGGLEHIYVKETNPPIAVDADTAWYGFPDHVKVIEVPAESVELYKVAKGWKEFSSKIVAAQ